MFHYDYLIVGAGLSAAVFAHEARSAGKKCLVIDRRDHIAGNVYTHCENGIDVHEYGAHIFHTSDKRVWDYVRHFAEFNHYVNAPIANFHGAIYNLPFNMNTFTKIWPDVSTPDQARARIAEQVAAENIKTPANLEEQALCLVGRDIFEVLIKEYTEKQWGCACNKLPAFIIKRLPVRYIYDNNYFNDCYQGIPRDGYTHLVAAMLDGVEVRLKVEYAELIAAQPDIAARIIYCGPIDEFFDYRLGPLEYRSLRFETKLLEGVDNWQGNAVVNYTSHDVDFTRIIEHKHFTFGLGKDGQALKDTIITREYPAVWKPGGEPYYPINDDKNNMLYAEYAKLAAAQDDVVFAGRLGSYKYFDMAPCIAASLDLAARELS